MLKQRQNVLSQEKKKYHDLYIGKEKSQTLCPTLKIYEEEIPKSDETKYLGDWITTDGLNNKNITEREK